VAAAYINISIFSHIIATTNIILLRTPWAASPIPRSHNARSLSTCFSHFSLHATCALAQIFRFLRINFPAVGAFQFISDRTYVICYIKLSSALFSEADLQLTIGFHPKPVSCSMKDSAALMSRGKVLALLDLIISGT
jgi:hypothetical protein